MKELKSTILDDYGHNILSIAKLLEGEANEIFDRIDYDRNGLLDGSDFVRDDSKRQFQKVFGPFTNDKDMVEMMQDYSACKTNKVGYVDRKEFFNRLRAVFEYDFITMCKNRA